MSTTKNSGIEAIETKATIMPGASGYAPNTQMSDTPRTDAQQAQLDAVRGLVGASKFLHMACVARTFERELAEAKAERDENGRLADNAQDGWRKSLEERQKLAAYAEALKDALMRFDRTCRVFDQTPTPGCECVGCIATRALAAEGGV